jgi:DNA repair exonuclease SbcCD ATPase subunit
MIIFKKLRYRNFLSTGNNFTEIDLTKSKRTLIVGTNGSGKSSSLDALSFALFGKSHRNINKPQLVNSINNKNCEVEVEFELGSNQYKVRRGIKPTIFEIYQNGNLLNQSSTSKDYQKILEQNILKLNHKSFHQIVVLGASSFIPFMQLRASDRRSVIEDLLDIGVFSKMNILLKEKLSTVKETLKDYDHQLEIARTKQQAQEKHIEDLRQLSTRYREQRQQKIEQAREQIDELQQKKEDINQLIKQADPSSIKEKNLLAHNQKQSILSELSRVQTSIKALVKDAKFFTDNDQCPTCSQDIDEDIRAKHIEKAKTDAKELKSQQENFQKLGAEVNQSIKELEQLILKVRQYESDIQAINRDITNQQKIIEDIQDEINTLESSNNDLVKAKLDYDKIWNEREKISTQKESLNEKYTYYLAISEMLKDTGIKTKVIKQYLPVINQLVNQYLQVMDFFVSFHLDENFEETIRSRHRDVFSYDSFSEGEKSRIDLSLLFTWRQIAKMKNSVSTNLLVLDEVMDSSLDAEGVEHLMKIFYTLDDMTNVFVISHKKEIMEEKFDRRLTVSKEKNFSIIHEQLN